MVDVVVVRWPEERDDATRLADAGAALLYLVAPDDDPPLLENCLQDWVRIPGDERDLRARIDALKVRAAAHAGPPWITDDGVLHCHGKSAHLAPNEARLARVLVAHFDEVVADEMLSEHAMIADPTRTLRAEVADLRAHLRTVDLQVRRVLNRGYRLLAR
jgi:two-component system, OmpR family, response regulator